MAKYIRVDAFVDAIQFINPNDPPKNVVKIAGNFYYSGKYISQRHIEVGEWIVITDMQETIISNESFKFNYKEVE